MLIQCTNRKCNEKDHFKLNLATDKVYCNKCGEVVEINHFTKTSLKSIGQVSKGAGEHKKTYSYECSKCKKHDRPIIEDGKLICPECKEEHKLPASITQMLLINLKNFKDEI